MVATVGTRLRRIAVVWILLLPMASFVRAQSVSLGLSAGLPLTHLSSADDGLVSATGHFTLGPAVRVHLPRAFAFDVELLYKRLEIGFASEPSRIVNHRLELPLLLRYVFPGSFIRPFVHAGLAYNWLITGGSAGACPGSASGEGFYCIGDKTVAQLRHGHTNGPVLGTGADFRLKKLRLAPELRITRWVDRNFGTRDSPLRSSLTQIELLIGFKF